jgi:CheY-like chemotaxis protein
MILFIDDERRRMKSYVEALELYNYPVIFEPDVAEAIVFFENNDEYIKLVILDVMMPTSDIFDDRCAEDGLRTGICFHDKIRQYDRNIPVIIFTNFRKDELSSIVEHHNTCILYKNEILPFDLVNTVDKLINIKDGTE